jgi:MinD-like ATPase involved in chromosome partitioning or flagellar assembly/DNA-binding response OmpR family regulator
VNEVPTALICDGNKQRLSQNKHLLGMFFQVEAAADPVDGLAFLKNQSFQIAFMDKEMGIDFFSLCLRLNPELWIIVAGEQWTEEEAIQLQEIGIRQEDIFQYPFLTDDLREILEALGYTAPSQAYSPSVPVTPYPGRGHGNHAMPNPSGSSQESPVRQGYGFEPMQQAYSEMSVTRQAPVDQRQQLQPQAPWERPSQGNGRGKPAFSSTLPRGVYSVYAPKGGVGKTTVVTNMAVTLASRTQARVCLVDFDIFFGNVAALLKLNPNRTVLDWIHTPEQMEEAMVYDCLIQHPSGLWVLPAPVKAIEEEFITAEIAEKILAHLRTYFDLVLVDLGPVFRDSTLIAFQHSEKIFMISDLDRLTLSDSIEMADEFKDMNVPLGKVEMIFNNISGSEGINSKRVKDAMPYPVIGSIPMDPKLKWVNNNKDEPIILALPKSLFSKALLSITNQLFEFGTMRTKEKKRSLFSLFSGRQEGGANLR